MPKGRTNNRYEGKFKQTAIETMREENLGIKETARRFGVHKSQIQSWERIYLEEGPEALYIERRGRSSAGKGNTKGRPPGLSKEVEKDLIAENQRLRAENEYLKNLNALVQKRVQQEKNPR